MVRINIDFRERILVIWYQQIANRCRFLFKIISPEIFDIISKPKLVRKQAFIFPFSAIKQSFNSMLEKSKFLKSIITKNPFRKNNVFNDSFQQNRNFFYTLFIARACMRACASMESYSSWMLHRIKKRKNSAQAKKNLRRKVKEKNI